jgi:putative transcriptional regulator
VKGTDLLKFPKQKLVIGPGKVLLAEPFMAEPYFKRSVILVTEHNDEGSFGLIINKPIKMTFNQALPDAPAFKATLSLGGPVSKETLHFLHRLGNKIPGSKTIAKGLYWGGDFDQVMGMMMDKILDTKDIRMFVGYAGWSAGQLDNELKMNSWIIEKANATMVFRKDPDELWGNILYKMGDPYRKMVNFPEDPNLN